MSGKSKICGLDGCGNMFEPRGGQKFCSAECRERSYARAKPKLDTNFGVLDVFGDPDPPSGETEIPGHDHEGLMTELLEKGYSPDKAKRTVEIMGTPVVEGIAPRIQIQKQLEDIDRKRGENSARMQKVLYDSGRLGDCEDLRLFTVKMFASLADAIKTLHQKHAEFSKKFKLPDSDGEAMLKWISESLMGSCRDSILSMDSEFDAFMNDLSKVRASHSGNATLEKIGVDGKARNRTKRTSKKTAA